MVNKKVVFFSIFVPLLLVVTFCSGCGALIYFSGHHPGYEKRAAEVRREYKAIIQLVSTDAEITSDQGEGSCSSGVKDGIFGSLTGARPYSGATVQFDDNVTARKYYDKMKKALASRGYKITDFRYEDTKYEDDYVEGIKKSQQFKVNVDYNADDEPRDEPASVDVSVTTIDSDCYSDGSSD